MDDEVKDQVAQMRAALDQAKEAVKEMAHLLWEYHSALIDEGFTPADAMQLTVEFFRQQMNYTKED